jgi:hypothetical protein
MRLLSRSNFTFGIPEKQALFVSDYPLVLDQKVTGRANGRLVEKNGRCSQQGGSSSSLCTSKVHQPETQVADGGQMTPSRSLRYINGWLRSEASGQFQCIVVDCSSCGKGYADFLRRLSSYDDAPIRAKRAARRWHIRPGGSVVEVICYGLD